MVRAKTKELPFLSDEEVEDLIKNPPKKVNQPKMSNEVIEVKPKTVKRKKPIEKIIEPLSMEKPTLKPIKSTVKKLQDKVLADVKKLEVEKTIPIIQEKTPDIEYVLTTTTKFDLNWYYLKEKLIRLKNFLLSPYRIYADWFNETFNKPNPIIKINEGIEYETLKDLFEDLPDSDNNEWNVIKVNEVIGENIEERNKRIIDNELTKGELEIYESDK